MKRFLQNMVARGLCLLAIGILLIAFSGTVTTWIVRICGLAFIVPGLVATISAVRHTSEGKAVMLYPVIGVGSILFGLVMLIWPGLFVTAVMYLLAAGLIFVSACQLYSLWSMHRRAIRFNASLYVGPVAELALGLYIIIARAGQEVAGVPVILIGAGFIVYALMELTSAVIVRRAARLLTTGAPADAVDANAVEVEAVEVKDKTTEEK